MSNSAADSAIEPRGLESRGSWLSPYSWFTSWKYTSMAALVAAEKRILASLWDKIENNMVSIFNGTKHIRTIALNSNSDNTPLVMVHGMGSGVGLWVLNLEALSKNRPLYAFDMLGFGRSSRVKFSTDALLAEAEFIESIEEWRKAMKLEKFILLGHSLGGFLASSYTIRYPERVRHLVLVDPWGFPEKPKDPDKKLPVPVWIKVVARMLQPFNPLAALRAAGPWGPGLVEKFRPDLVRKYEHLFTDNTVAQYVFHCNAQEPSGEAAFKNLTIPFGWAKFPMINRMADIDKSIPMTVVHGSRSWIDSGIGWQIKYLRSESYVDVQVVRGAGHHIYADKAFAFNNLVNRVCTAVDSRADLLSVRVSPRRHLSSESTLTDAEHKGADGGARRRVRCESMPAFPKDANELAALDTRRREAGGRAATGGPGGASKAGLNSTSIGEEEAETETGEAGPSVGQASAADKGPESVVSGGTISPTVVKDSLGI